MFWLGLAPFAPPPEELLLEPRPRPEAADPEAARPKRICSPSPGTQPTVLHQTMSREWFKQSKNKPEPRVIEGSPIGDMIHENVS